MKNASWNIAHDISTTGNPNRWSLGVLQAPTKKNPASKAKKLEALAFLAQKYGAFNKSKKKTGSPLVINHFAADGSEPPASPIRHLRNDTLSSLDIKIKPRGVLKKKSSFARPSTMSCLRQGSGSQNGQSQQPKIRRNISITFKESVRVRKVESCSELVKHPNELWYQKDEFREIKRDVKRSVESVELAEMLGGEHDECIRGLERHLPSNRHALQYLKDNVYDTVLDQQHDTCPEEIAQMYKSLSTNNLRQAAERAKKDADESQLSHDQISQMYKSLSTNCLRGPLLHSQ